MLVTSCAAGLPFDDNADEAALVASGTFRATELHIAGELGGRIETIYVATGEDVAAGEPLAKLETTPWELQLGPAEAAVETARAELAALEAGPHPAEIDAARAGVMLAQAQRDTAMTAWQDALDVAEDPQAVNTQIVEARGQLALAAQGVELAEAQLAREEMMHGIAGDGDTAKQAADLQLLGAREALAAAEAQEAIVRTLLNHLYAIRSNPLGFIAQANALRGRYEAAEAAVRVAEAELEDLLDGPTPQEVAVAEAAVRRAEAEANILRVKIARSTVTSPISGTVTAEIARIGELVAPAATILTVADLSEVMLDVYVSEGRIGRVRVGQAVTVTVDSFPGESFAGRVVSIGDSPEFTPRNVATTEERLNTFYTVEIRLPNPEGRLKPGMPADARF
jgi:HlyD family secretion protein